MKVFVTGVGGQLGFDVVNELKKRSYEAAIFWTKSLRTVPMSSWISPTQTPLKQRSQK